MLNNTPPVPERELERLLELSALDLDYSRLEAQFKNLTKLAATLTGKPIALINLIDSFTQWTIAEHGVPVTVTPREDTICQYTIANSEDLFEVKNLTEDERFKNMAAVATPGGLRYYLGVQLKSINGEPLGALCVADITESELTQQQIEVLRIIADEIVERLYSIKNTYQLNNDLNKAKEESRLLAQDIQEPLAGVIGILDILTEEPESAQFHKDTLQYLDLVLQRSREMLGRTNSVLEPNEERLLNGGQGDLVWLKNAIETLYLPLSSSKGIELRVSASERTQYIPFKKDRLLQLVGNLTSYAIVTAVGEVNLHVSLKVEADHNTLHVWLEYLPITNNGIAQVFGSEILSSAQRFDTQVQALLLIKELVSLLGGNISTTVTPTGYRRFDLHLPQHTA